MAKIKDSLKQLAKEFKSLEIKQGKKKEILKALGLEHRASIRRSFVNECSPSGENWEENDIFYKKWKEGKVGKKKILEFTGKLQKRFYTKIQGDDVIVGSKSSIAEVHQFGLEGLPKRDFLGPDKEFEKNMEKRIKKIYRGL